MNNRRHIRLAKEGSWIVLGQVASVLGALVLVRVLTEYLDPTQYGQLALGLTAAGLVNQVVMGGISAGIGRFYSVAVEKGDLPGYLDASRRLTAYATLVVSAIGVVLLVGLFLLQYSQWMALAAAALILSLLSGYNASLSGIQNAARQRATVAFHAGLDAWLKIMFAIGVMLWLGSSGAAVVIGYVLSSLLVTCSQFFFFRGLIPHQNADKSDRAEWMRQIWTFSWPFSAFGIFTWVQLSSERWALEAFANTHEVGLYSVLYQLGYTPISMVIGLTVSFITPIVYQRSGDATDAARNATVHQLAWRITLSSLVMTLILFALTLGLHGWIFRLLVASQYQSVSYLLPWVLLAGGLFAASQMLSLKLMSDMKTASMMRAKIMSALLGISLNIYFASVAGLEGVVVALIAFNVINFIWMVNLTIRIPSQKNVQPDMS